MVFCKIKFLLYANWLTDSQLRALRAIINQILTSRKESNHA